MVEMVQHDRTSDPTFRAMFLAKQINEQMGGPFIAPWEVAQLPNDWLDAFALLRTDLTQLRRNAGEFNNFVNDWRRKALAQRH